MALEKLGTEETHPHRVVREDFPDIYMRIGAELAEPNVFLVKETRQRTGCIGVPER